MRKTFRLLPIHFSVLASLFFASMPLYAHNCDDAYDAGYDDGYEDCMEDSPCPLIKPITWTGVYIGAEAGYQAIQAKKWVIFEDNNIGTLRSSATGPFGNVFIGYGKNWDRYYLGGELFTGYSGANNTDSINTLGSTDNIKLSAGASYGIALLPGYKLPSGPLLYARVGYQATDFTLKEYSTGTFQMTTSKSNWSNGFTYGLGMEAPLFNNFDLRLDYRRVCYDSFTNPTTGTKITPSDNQATLGGVYRIPF